MRLVVHLGLHRAASTAIQDWLVTHRAVLAAEGCHIAAGPQTGLEGQVLNVLTGQTFAEVAEEAVAAMVCAGLDDLARHFACAIMSDENLPGPMPNATRAPFLRADRLARVLGRVARHHEVIPVIVLREHVTWMESLYRVAQLRGETVEFEVFARNIASRPALFAGLVEPVTAACDAEDAIITSQKALAADGGAGFLGMLTGLLGVSVPGDGRLRRRNASRHALVCSLAQEAARSGCSLDLRANPRLSRLLDEIWPDPSAVAPGRMLAAARLLRQALVPGDGAGGPIRPVAAERMLERAITRARRPLVPPALAADLRQFFAVDRGWICDHHPGATLEE